MLNLPALSSNGIILEPLSLSYADDLAKACQDGELWKANLTFVPNPETVTDYIDKAELMSDRYAFAVINEATGKAIGSTSYCNIMPLAKRLDIGYTWYAKSYWRTHVNSSCKLMMMSYAFESLGYQTIGWRTDFENYQSQQAIERLGAKKEGVIRGDRVRKNGCIADSAAYSMIRSEWDAAKLKLQEKLASYN